MNSILSINLSKFKVEPISSSASIYLDFLRVVFAQLVLVGHAASFFSVISFIHPPNFAWVQSIAVVGFFWLSGFLICHSSLAKQSYNFLDFFIDRFSRIYSAYIPALLFVFIFDGLFILAIPEKYNFYSSFSFLVAIENFFMLQKIPTGVYMVPLFGSGSTWWTLGIEWWLYMFFGWFFVKNRSAKQAKCYWYLFVVLFISLLPLHYRAGHLIFGLSFIWFIACGFSLIKDSLTCLLRARLLVILSMFFLVLSLVRYRMTINAYDLLAAIFLGGFFLFSVCWFQKVNVKFSLWVKKIIRFLAGYSFTLFLTHYTILNFIAESGLLVGWGAFLVGFIVSNIVAAILASFSEIKYRYFSAQIRELFVCRVVRKL